jgi:phage baseplate assembly protein W
MAFNVQQINPLDLQPSVGIGVGLPFTSGEVFTTTYTTQDAIKSNLINYFLTGKSERFFNPDLGAGLRAVLFDQMTQESRDQVEYIVQTGLSTWFPNVIVNQITTEVSPDTNLFTLFLRYSIANTNIQDELLINFEQ